ncbi:type II toxin-antitoxin system HipA family toxin [Eubacterium sp.]
MKQDNKINVFYEEKLVGTLAMTSNQKVAFEYCDSWLKSGFPISPFSLPLEKKVFVPQKIIFDGLYGVFADSLPDAWGKLLLERMLKEHGKNPSNYDVLDRLAIVGKSGMGALTYEPIIELNKETSIENLDELALQCEKILNIEYSENLDQIYNLGGTSGGARPKIMTSIDGEDWIIKFAAYVDGKNAGKMEYEYSLCAKKCGINMTETRLFNSELCNGYFGIKRFDRYKDKNKIKRKHMLTAAAILEIDFNQPCLDYMDLMKMTKILTDDNDEDIENLYRRMCFNVYAHNRDDHAKNFTYIYDEKNDKWHLSPAYDLTYSNTYYGEHTTTVSGNGKNPGLKELVEVGICGDMKKQTCVDIANKIKNNVESMLGEYII